MNWYNRIFGIQDIDQMADEQMSQEPQEPQEEPQREGPSPVANLNLVLYENGHVQLIADWLEQSDSTATMYGKFLYKILSGQVEPFVLEQLSIYAQTGVASPVFIEKVLFKYRDEKLDNDNEPIVKPSDALKLKQTRGEDASIS